MFFFCFYYFYFYGPMQKAVSHLNIHNAILPSYYIKALKIHITCWLKDTEFGILVMQLKSSGTCGLQTHTVSVLNPLERFPCGSHPYIPQLTVPWGALKECDKSRWQASRHAVEALLSSQIQGAYKHTESRVTQVRDTPEKVHLMLTPAMKRRDQMPKFYDFFVATTRQ